jgi:eukaryotic-like serine/threonine-protein kinase
MNQGTQGPTRSSRGHGSERKDNGVGAVVCGWSLERLLGLGPVCESWLAARGGAPDSVVRVLREPFASDPLARAAWLGASWAANRFSHARVPRVMQDGSDGRGAPVVVRRWANGKALEQIVRGGVMEPRLALQLAEQLLDALEMAHAHGIVHGALSPSNVVVTPRGTVRVLDFATMPGRIAGPADALLRAHVSPYMAPQQRAALAAIDPKPAFARPTEQSDVWSVGACLHFAIAGKAPDLDAPSLRRAAAGTEADVAAVVDRALATDPFERYESAYAMLGDIRRVLTGRTPRLEAAAVALPSQSPAELQGSSESTSGVLALDAAADGRARSVAGGAPPQATAHARRTEWRGNLVLFVAIALMVAVATFVLVRERLGDDRAPPDPPPRTLHRG